MLKKAGILFWNINRVFSWGCGRKKVIQINEDLREARKLSRQALYLSITALTISVIHLIVRVYTLLQLI